MGSDEYCQPEWLRSPPAMFDIVTGFFPETSPQGEGPKLRPLLITRVLLSKKTGGFACTVAYGTSKLVVWRTNDVVVQNLSDLNEIGLPKATRFVVDPAAQVTLPWDETNFGCWSGFASPRIGALTLPYQKDYAFSMMQISSK